MKEREGSWDTGRCGNAGLRAHVAAPHAAAVIQRAAREAMRETGHLARQSNTHTHTNSDQITAEKMNAFIHPYQQEMSH